MTTEVLMVGAIRRGLSLADFEVLTVGMLIDYVATYNAMVYGNKEEGVKKASQADFDNF